MWTARQDKKRGPLPRKLSPRKRARQLVDKANELTGVHEIPEVPPVWTAYLDDFPEDEDKAFDKVVEEIAYHSGTPKIEIQELRKWLGPQAWKLSPPCESFGA